MDMLKSKTIDRICCFALAMMLVLTCVVWAGKASVGLKQNVAVGYEGLFDQGVVHTIDIEMDDWDSFIASATQAMRKRFPTRRTICWTFFPAASG